MPVTKYIWDQENYLAEADGSDAIGTVYTNEPQQYGNLVSSRISGTASYHHFDAIGSTRQLTTNNGTVSDTWVFDAAGSQMARTGATIVRHLWIGAAGYCYDSELSAHFVRARQFIPAVARWASLDPLGLADDLNPYKYSANRPLVLSDPSGTTSGDDSTDATKYFEHSPGNPMGCIILFVHGRGGNASDKTSGMYIAASETHRLLTGVFPGHFIADLVWDAEIDLLLQKQLVNRCCIKSVLGVEPCVILLGHSAGGKRAIDLADWFVVQSKTICSNLGQEAIPMKPSVSLLTIDAFDGTSAVTKGPTNKPKEFLNFFQKIDRLARGESINSANENKEFLNTDSDFADYVAKHGEGAHTAIDNYVAEKQVVKGMTSGEWAAETARPRWREFQTQP